MFKNAVILDPQSGYALSAEHQRVAEVINEYDPHLELIWIPPNERAESDRQPFAVRHNPPGRESYIVFRLAENEVDYRVLVRLFTGDNARQDVLTTIEAGEAARRLLDMKKQLDEQEEAKEIATWALGARSGAKHNGVRYE
jgi:hypothetical protein